MTRVLGRKSGISKRVVEDVNQLKLKKSILMTAWPIWTVSPEQPAAYLSRAQLFKAAAAGAESYIAGGCNVATDKKEAVRSHVVG
jgi:hypothetical protein